MKYLVALGFAAIITSLGFALVFMLRSGNHDNARSKKMAWALALRVALSILLFICVLLAWKLGFIQPTGIPAGR